MELTHIPNFENTANATWMATFHPEDFPKKELLQAEVPWVHFASTYNGTSEDPLILNLFKFAVLSGSTFVVNTGSLSVKKHSPNVLLFRVLAERFGLSDNLANFANFPYREMFLKFASTEVTDYSFAHYTLFLHALVKTITAKSRSVQSEYEIPLIQGALNRVDVLPEPETMQAFFNLYFAIQYVAFNSFKSKEIEEMTWGLANSNPEFADDLANDLWRSQAMNVDYDFIAKTIEAGEAEWVGVLDSHALKTMLVDQ